MTVTIWTLIHRRNGAPGFPEQRKKILSEIKVKMLAHKSVHTTRHFKMYFIFHPDTGPGEGGRIPYDSASTNCVLKNAKKNISLLSHKP
jgi:hypothetical protein